MTLIPILGILFVFFFFLSLSKKTAIPFPLLQTPTPTPVSVDTLTRNQIKSPLEKTTIDKTTQQQVEKIQDVVASASPEDTTTYTFPSVNALIPNEVQTQNGVVTYERTSTFTSDPGGFPSLQGFMRTLGSPEQTIQGNIVYGEGINAYLFPNKGVVLIGNPATDETYEIQRFTPMSVIEYLRQYGDSVKQPLDNAADPTLVGQ